MYVYHHAKFGASTLENGRVITILNFRVFGIIWYVIAWYIQWALSNSTTMQNFNVLAWKMAELLLF